MSTKQHSNLFLTKKKTDIIYCHSILIVNSLELDVQLPADLPRPLLSAGSTPPLAIRKRPKSLLLGQEPVSTDIQLERDDAQLDDKDVTDEM